MFDFKTHMKHKNGSYSSLLLSDQSKSDLHSFVRNHIDPTGDIIDPDTYHITLMYSRVPCPKSEEVQFELPIFAIPTHFELFDPSSDGGSNCLVLRVNCGKANILHNTFNMLGASYDFDQYKPHITVVKNYDGLVKEIPTPNFKLCFANYEITSLEEEILNYE